MDMTNEQRIHRAAEAQRFRDSEIVKDLLNGLDAHYVAAWRNSKTLDAREDAYRYMMILNKFTQDLAVMAGEGEFTKRRISELEGQPKRRWGL